MVNFLTSLFSMERFINRPLAYESSSVMGGSFYGQSSPAFTDFFSHAGASSDWMRQTSFGYGSTMASGRFFARTASEIMSWDALEGFNNSIAEAAKTPIAQLFVDGGVDAAGGSVPATQAQPSPQMPQSSSQLDASTDPIDGPDETEETPEIPEESLADAKTRLQQEAGYDADEAAAIVARVETEAAGDAGEFGRILSTLPVKSAKQTNQQTGETTTTTNPNWVENFGMWYSREILDMPEAQAREYVRGRAFESFIRPESSGDESRLTITQGAATSIKIDGRDTSATEFTVSEAADGTGIANGTTLYRVGSNSHATWYRKNGDSYQVIPFLTGGRRDRDHLYISRGDYLTLVEPKVFTTENGDVYEEYTIQPGSAVGRTASPLDEANDKLYLRDGKWFTMNAEGAFTEITPKPTFNADTGKLRFGAEPTYITRVNFNNSLAADRYMDALDENSEQFTTEATARTTSADELREQKVGTVAEQLSAQDGFGGQGLEAVASEDGKSLELRCAAGRETELIEYLKNHKQELNAILAKLPEGTRITFNGEQPPIETVDTAAWIISELTAAQSAEVSSTEETPAAEEAPAESEETPAQTEEPVAEGETPESAETWTFDEAVPEGSSEEAATPPVTPVPAAEPSPVATPAPAATPEPEATPVPEPTPTPATTVAPATPEATPVTPPDSSATQAAFIRRRERQAASQTPVTTPAVEEPAAQVVAATSPPPAAEPAPVVEPTPSAEPRRSIPVTIIDNGRVVAGPSAPAVETPAVATTPTVSTPPAATPPVAASPAPVAAPVVANTEDYPDLVIGDRIDLRSDTRIETVRAALRQAIRAGQGDGEKPDEIMFADVAISNRFSRQDIANVLLEIARQRTADGKGNIRINLSIYDSAQPDRRLESGTMTVAAASDSDGRPTRLYESTWTAPAEVASETPASRPVESVTAGLTSFPEESASSYASYTSTDVLAGPVVGSIGSSNAPEIGLPDDALAGIYEFAHSSEHRAINIAPLNAGRNSGAGASSGSPEQLREQVTGRVVAEVDELVLPAITFARGQRIAIAVDLHLEPDSGGDWRPGQMTFVSATQIAGAAISQAKLDELRRSLQNGGLSITLNESEIAAVSESGSWTGRRISITYPGENA